MDAGSGSGLIDRYFLSEDLLSLTIFPVSLHDEGRYTLTASNPAGSHSASIQLTVYGRDSSHSVAFLF